MTEPIVSKILVGLIITLTAGFFIQIISRFVEKKAEEMSNSKKVGFLVFIILMVVYYVAMLFYWIGLLNESFE